RTPNYEHRTPTFSRPTPCTTSGEVIGYALHMDIAGVGTACRRLPSRSGCDRGRATAADWWHDRWRRHDGGLCRGGAPPHGDGHRDHNRIATRDYDPGPSRTHHHQP